MAGDRRAALLTAVVLAAGVGAAAVVVPLRAHAIPPQPGDLAVGWSLLAGALLSIRRMPVAASLGAAGVLWVVVGLAPLGPAAAEQPLSRLALVPAALLTCAAAGLAARPYRWPVFGASGVTLIAAALGGAGSGPIALVGIGAAALVVPALLTPRSATSVVQLGVGLGVMTCGLAATNPTGLPADTARATGLLTLAVGGLAVGWWARSRTSLDGRGLMSAGFTEPGPALGQALGRALGTGPVTVAFPAPGQGWLDHAGRPCSPGPMARDVLDTDGAVLARTNPVLSVDPGLVPDLHRFLRAAGQGARLRSAMRRRAVELDRSRKRLLTSSDEERLRLVFRLEAGPLRQLEVIADRLCAAADGASWRARLTDARRTLDELVGGLDPVESAGGLVPALNRLAEAAGALVYTEGPVPDHCDPVVNRAVWFACAEALANVRKHAPDARATVTVVAHEHLVVTVDDDGPGGADPEGTGLAGLADRLAGVGGLLNVRSSSTGTTVEIKVPMSRRTPPDGIAALTPTTAGPVAVQP
jgi:hypothetical protein